MISIALKMLFGDTGKFMGIVIGVTLAALVIAQQGGIFLGFMRRANSTVHDTPAADLWVVDQNAEFMDDVSKLSETKLLTVRGVEGVRWAVPMHRGIGRVRLESGKFRYVNLIGIDDETFIGGPSELAAGSIEGLRRADAVIVDAASARTLLARPPTRAGGEPTPIGIGDTLELNDRRAVVVGLAGGTPQINEFPTIWTTFRRAVQYVPAERKQLTFVLCKLEPGADAERVRSIIAERTGLASYTSGQFEDLTLGFYLRHGHVIVIFGFVVMLGVVIGALITGFLFYNFTLDNLRYFATLKALGTGDAVIGRMLMAQALTVSLLGAGLGIGFASAFGTALEGSVIPFRMPWQLAAGATLAVMLICVCTAVVCLRRLQIVEPSSVFKA